MRRHQLMTIRTQIFSYFALVVLSLIAVQPSFADAGKALPADEAAKDATLVEFRQRLLDAIVRRDVDYVVNQAAVDIQLSFGGQAGREEFRRSLDNSTVSYLTSEGKHNADEAREQYWDALEEVLRMGGRFTKADVFEAPYTWTAKQPDGNDPFTTYFVISKAVPLRDRPSKYGSTVGTLSYDIVSSVIGGEGTKFQKVKLASGAQGFVHEDSLRSSIDYRAILKKNNQKWNITAFVSGD
jgi:hypothetical protein